MGFLDRFFDSRDTHEDTFWNTISNEQELDDIIKSSIGKPKVIFKHSNQCGTSFFAKRNLEITDKDSLERVDIYLIDVIRQRALSRYFGDKVGVRHESPQLFVLKDGAVVWHGSHHQVNENNLKTAINQALG